MFGQTTVDGDGKVVVVRKRAGFLTNCREMRDELSVVCDKSHSRGSLLGQGRAGRAAVYPLRLVAAMLRGLRKALEQSVNAIDRAAGPTVEDECPAAKEEFDKIYYDETTGAVLHPKLVAAAVQEELVSISVSTRWLCRFCTFSARHPPCCFCDGSLLALFFRSPFLCSVAILSPRPLSLCLRCFPFDVTRCINLLLSVPVLCL